MLVEIRQIYQCRENTRKTPRTRFNAKISPHRVVEGKTFPLADIKALRSLSDGSKVNDVFLSIIGGALRTYLDDKDELPDTTMTAMAPMALSVTIQPSDKTLTDEEIQQTADAIVALITEALPKA